MSEETQGAVATPEQSKPTSASATPMSYESVRESLARSLSGQSKPPGGIAPAESKPGPGETESPPEAEPETDQPVSPASDPTEAEPEPEPAETDEEPDSAPEGTDGPWWKHRLDKYKRQRDELKAKLAEAEARLQQQPAAPDAAAQAPAPEPPPSGDLDAQFMTPEERQRITELAEVRQYTEWLRGMRRKYATNPEGALKELQGMQLYDGDIDGVEQFLADAKERLDDRRTELAPLERLYRDNAKQRQRQVREQSKAWMEQHMPWTKDKSSALYQRFNAVMQTLDPSLKANPHIDRVLALAVQGEASLAAARKPAAPTSVPPKTPKKPGSTPPRVDPKQAKQGEAANRFRENPSREAAVDYVKQMMRARAK